MTINVHEIKIKSMGFPGAPGWTTFYYDGDDPTQYDDQFRSAKTWLGDVSGFFPTPWSAAVQTEGRVLLAATGVLEEITTIPDDGTGDVVDGTMATAAYGAGVAGLVTAYTTAGVNRGRTVRGRTFMVPLGVGAYDADGTISDSFLATFAADMTTWATTAPALGVWSRPRAGAGGAWFPVLSVHVTDQAAVLRTRR